MVIRDVKKLYKDGADAVILEMITQEEFDAYEDVRQSGVTNMFNVSVVSDYSGLSRDKIITIISNYNTLAEKYGH